MGCKQHDQIGPLADLLRPAHGVLQHRRSSPPRRRPAAAGRRNGTSPPQPPRLLGESPASSVETMTRVSRLASRAEASAWPIRTSGRAARRFLRGRPLEPPRAGNDGKRAGSVALEPDPPTLRGRSHGGQAALQRLRGRPSRHTRARPFRERSRAKWRASSTYMSLSWQAKGWASHRWAAVIEDADLVQRPVPPNDAALAGELELPVHDRREQAHVQVTDACRPGSER